MLIDGHTEREWSVETGAFSTLRLDDRNAPSLSVISIITVNNEDFRHSCISMNFFLIVYDLFTPIDRNRQIRHEAT